MSISRTTRVSDHFRLGEFFPPGTRHRTLVRSLPAVRQLVDDVLEPLRAQFGACTVHSGHRNRAKNAAVGGAPLSYHRYGLRRFEFAAADVSFARGTPGVWAAAAQRGPAGGIGIYATHLHVDTREERTVWRA